MHPWRAWRACAYVLPARTTQHIRSLRNPTPCIETPARVCGQSGFWKHLPRLLAFSDWRHRLLSGDCLDSGHLLPRTIFIFFLVISALDKSMSTNISFAPPLRSYGMRLRPSLRFLMLVVSCISWSSFLITKWWVTFCDWRSTWDTGTSKKTQKILMCVAWELWPAL